MRLKQLAIWGACTACTFLAAQATQAAFTINLQFSDTTSAAQQQVFNDAKAYWESVIVGYKAGVNLQGLTISASVEYIDGTNQVLGQAGPKSAVIRSGTTYTSTGEMKFDSADYGSGAGGSFYQVVLHEMAHVIGLGTLWDDNGLYVNGSGQYTGATALAAYKIEYGQPSATSVPVELDGGPGTANGHWDENLNGNTIVDRFGRSLSNELMTGFLNEPTYVSFMTKAQFQDLGYVVVIPEPAAFGLLAPAALMLRRRR